MVDPSSPSDVGDGTHPTVTRPAAAQVTHSAQPAALGYTYQVQYALLELLRDGPDRPDGRITLEKYDDVAWIADESPTDKLQTKYRRMSVRDLGDYSPDLWKTIKSWLDGEAPAHHGGSSLYLVTTQFAAEGTVAESLRPGNTRSVREAVRRLTKAAHDSKDRATQKARDAYLALSESDRFAFVGRIHVLDCAPTLPDITIQLARHIKPFAPNGREAVFTTSVLGWWHSTSIDLLEDAIESVSYDQAHAAISRIRDTFLSDQTLPAAPGANDPVSQSRRDELQAAYGGYRFVQRMIDVAFPPRNLQLALLDYYRAVSSTTFWLQNSLVMPHEVALFERRLKEEWEREFEFMCVDLGPDASESDKRRRGHDLLRRLLDAAEIRIRPEYHDLSLARGTRHTLADNNKIAWHPDFAAELEQLLEVT